MKREGKRPGMARLKIFSHELPVFHGFLVVEACSSSHTWKSKQKTCVVAETLSLTVLLTVDELAIILNMK